MLEEIMTSEWKHMAEDWERYCNHYAKFPVAKLFHIKPNEPTKKQSPMDLFFYLLPWEKYSYFYMLP